MSEPSAVQETSPSLSQRTASQELNIDRRLTLAGGVEPRCAACSAGATFKKYGATTREPQSFCRTVKLQIQMQLHGKELKNAFLALGIKSVQRFCHHFERSQ